ncbi:diguanylate cyclase [Anaerobacillus alkaliphilus]|uniref:Diguanylate cyclase n=1 Tax=Anaerobacillus alkaliphilus TaxID=1548597 RepID=A0A4Q0VQ09_9BACI|nr:histidine kinase N-terminal 7TM domain-containing protein [Anaerobacillus alkaliphilus]RXI96435.1 diguanylate cyclase [Anaerobacillus alkaliphilus]
MPQELLIYVVMGVFGCVLTVFLCLYGLLKVKDAPGGTYYILCTFMCTIFTASYLFELTSTSLEQMKFWLGIEYLALPFIPVFVLLMCFEYVGKKIPKPMYYFLIGLPLTTIFMHFTNDFHHLYYSSIAMRTDTPFPILVLEGGPWFYVHSFFLYICIVASIVILFLNFRKKSFTFRMQILMMAAGLFTPVLGSILYLTGLGPYGLDYGPLSMSISFLFHGAALVSYQMFNVAPIARETVFESMQDGVLVLDQKGIIIDYNKTMTSILPKINTFSIGKPVEDILEKKHRLYELMINEQECDVEFAATHYHIRFSPVLLQGTIVGKIITFIDVSERVLLQEKLEKLASIDGLTQVFNRTFFFKKVEQTFDDLKQQGATVSFIMFDIDHFKKINDTYGHEAGDHVITHVIDVTKSCLRDTDVIGRYGGEEFVIFMPHTTGQVALEVANLIRNTVSSNTIFLEGKQVIATSSFGISTVGLTLSSDCPTIPMLVNQADKALYQAKEKGRNYVQEFQKLGEHIGA